jgi:hypothetical protein
MFNLRFSMPAYGVDVVKVQDPEVGLVVVNRDLCVVVFVLDLGVCHHDEVQLQ